MKRYSVLILDDYRPAVDQVKELLTGEKDMEVVGVAENGREGLMAAMRLNPDLILMDLQLPDESGAKIAREIKKGLPHSILIIYSRLILPNHISEVLEAGVHGFIAKDVSSESLLAGIRSAINGNYPFVLPPDLGFSIDPHKKAKAMTDNFNLLTPREKEIFLLIAEGWTNVRIAKHLVLSPKTVDSHRTNLMRKLEIHSVRDLIKLAIKKNIISSDP